MKNKCKLKAIKNPHLRLKENIMATVLDQHLSKDIIYNKSNVHWRKKLKERK